jgi:hypothetical protein
MKTVPGIVALVLLAGCATTKPCVYVAENPEGERYQNCVDLKASDAKARRLGEHDDRAFFGALDTLLRGAGSVK